MIPPESDAPMMGATSEVGRLRTVLLHRPGPELRRLTPRNNDQLLFDGVPWVARAQEEHDAFAAELTARGVEVLYLDRLLTEILSFPSARAELIGAAVDDPRLGATLQRATTDGTWPGSPPEDLAATLITGLAHDELRGGKGPGLRGHAARRLRRPPAAQPAVHPRLVGLGGRRGRGDLAGDAGPAPGEHDHRRDLHPPPAVRRGRAAVRLAARAPRGR